jgi:hypothetical protein
MNKEEIINDVKQKIEDMMDEIFLETQQKHNITSGDIYPIQAIKLETLQEQIAEIVANQILNIKIWSE